jgi:hypothetical protein
MSTQLDLDEQASQEALATWNPLTVAFLSWQKQLPDALKEWVATRVMSGAPSEEIQKELVAHGFSEPVAAYEIEQAQKHPYIAAGQRLAHQLKKRNWVLHTLHILQSLSPGAKQVERREKLGREEFFERYYTQNRPVIITGMLEAWPALTRWTPDYLKEKCGHHIVEVQVGRSRDPQYEINSDQYRRQMPFGEFVDWMNRGEETNDFYMTAKNSDANGAILEALYDDIPVIHEYLKDDDASNRGFFWYGPKGIVTPLHHDLTNNFMAQVRGRKQIRLISPCLLPNIYNHRHCYSQVDLNAIDYERFPDFRHITPLEVTLHPGEILFLPVGYWHHVVGLDISLTMTYTQFQAHNDFNSFYTTYESFE